jgi:hypothetical protein
MRTWEDLHGRNSRHDGVKPSNGAPWQFLQASVDVAVVRARYPTQGLAQVGQASVSASVRNPVAQSPPPRAAKLDGLAEWAKIGRGRVSFKSIAIPVFAIQDYDEIDRASDPSPA